MVTAVEETWAVNRIQAAVMFLPKHMWQNHPEAHKHFFLLWPGRQASECSLCGNVQRRTSVSKTACKFLSFFFSFFFSWETELPPRLAVELVTQLEMLIVRHARCHLGQRAAHDSPRRCLRVTRPVDWGTVAALLLWQWLVYPSKAIAARVMPPTWHAGLASAPSTLPRQSTQQRETGGTKRFFFYYYNYCLFFISIFFYCCTWKWKI